VRRRPIQAGIRAGGPEDPDARRRDELREALSYWASGVAVLAVSDGEEVDAMTVSAFTPLSLDPPLVLACVHLNASPLPTLREERRFTIGILPESGRRLASAFAQRLPLAESPWVAEEGDPVLRDALVTFVCRLWAEHPGGDHRMVVGEVERVVPGRGDAPLLFHRREYRGLGAHDV
jgi:flavin reductase (DIM6/NTAB) family NADH-FMN oxidoreductase RutF